MKAFDAIRILIREDRTDNEDADGAAPTSAPEPPSRNVTPTHAPDQMAHSELVRSYRESPFHKLIVFHAGLLWEVEPVENGKNFAFHQLKLQRVHDPLQPQTGDQLQRLERQFGLDRGLDSSHVTILK